jgi:hypothetical protein
MSSRSRRRPASPIRILVVACCTLALTATQADARYRLPTAEAKLVANLDVGLAWGVNLGLSLPVAVPAGAGPTEVTTGSQVLVTGCHRHGRSAMRCRLRARITVSVNGGPARLARVCVQPVRIRARHARHHDWRSPMVARARLAGAVSCSPPQDEPTRAEQPPAIVDQG